MKGYLSIDIIHCSKKFVASSDTDNQQLLHLATVYASTSQSIRRELWEELASWHMSRFGGCYIGDFNVVLGSQKMSGLLPS